MEVRRCSWCQSEEVEGERVLWWAGWSGHWTVDTYRACTAVSWNAPPVSSRDKGAVTTDQ